MYIYHNIHHLLQNILQNNEEHMHHFCKTMSCYKINIQFHLVQNMFHMFHGMLKIYFIKKIFLKSTILNKFFQVFVLLFCCYFVFINIVLKKQLRKKEKINEILTATNSRVHQIILIRAVFYTWTEERTNVRQQVTT